MPVLLILGPIFGLAALVALVAHGHKSSATPQAKAAPQSTRQIELDHGMPEALVHQVLTALVHEQDPEHLEALARELGAKYPIAASELHATAAALGGAKTEVATSPPPSPAAGPPAAAPPEPTAAATPDMGEAALILQAAMKAMTHETDPVSLEGFAESIRARYPTAAVLLVGRAHELHAAAQAVADAANASALGAHASLANPGPVPATSAPLALGTVASIADPTIAAPPTALGSLANPASAPPIPAAALSTKPATYVVQAGDTPAVIAERLAHDGKRWHELVGANPSKPTGPDGNFASLRQGETLNLPLSWGAAPTPHAHSNALPKEAHP